MINQLWKWFLQGIALIAPLALTIALVIWLATWSETVFGMVLKLFLPDRWYFQGLGIISAVVVTLAAGLVANIFLVRWLVRGIEAVLARIPLITTLYQAFKDVARLFGRDAGDQLGQVVAVDLGNMRLVGFVMQSESELPGEFPEDDDRVSVYLAMSYQVGGFTIHVPRSSVTPLDIAPDVAIRAVLTGGSLSPSAALESARQT